MRHVDGSLVAFLAALALMALIVVLIR